MKRLIQILFLITTGVCLGQSYHLSTENSLNTSTSECFKVSPAALGSQEGSIKINDNDGNTIGTTTGINEFNVRPFEFIVSKAECRYIEGPNRGKTFTLAGGYTITIDPTLVSYYERGNNGALYFEEINTSVLYELNCNTKSINASNVIVDTDVIEWEYRFEGNTKVLENSQSKASLPIDFENFEIDLNANNNKLIDFRYKLNGNVYSRWRTYTIVVCSPKLIEPGGVKEENATCSGANDGSVTLTFDGNIDGDSDMRYFIYQRPESASTPQDAFQGDTDSQFPPLPFAEVRLGSLVDNNNGTFSGSSTLGNIISGDGSLGVGEYYVLYQEVDYSTTPVTVKSGELAPDFFTITEPSPVDTNGILTPATCGNNAKITMSATGGNNLDNSGSYSYEYRINSGSWLPASNPLEITPTASQQTVGVRALYTTDKVCEGSSVNYIIDPETPPLTVENTSSVNTSTSLAIDGSIRVETSGGILDFDYTVDILNTSTGQWETIETQIDIPQRMVDFFNKGIGTFRITITDSKGCNITSENIIVTSDVIPMLASEQTDQISCFGGSDGRVSAEVSNFTSNYRYQWVINGAASTIQSGTSGIIELNNLNEPGDYELRVSSGRVSDADFNDPDNYSTATFLIDEPDPIVIDNIVANDVSCNGSNDGSIVLNLSGGVSYEYTFELAPIESDWIALNGDTITNLAPGFYRVTVRNENGCESAPSASVFIDEPEVLSVSENTGQRKDVTTNGGNDGEISIEITGGTMPYSFEWSGPNGFTSDQQNLVGLTAGDYQVTVTDANNCTENLGPINITEPGPLGITSLIVNDVLCKGDATGSITAEVSGTPPFTFVWNKDGDPSFSAPNQRDIVGLTEGTYTLELSDSSGDPSVTASVVVAEPLEALVGEIISTDASCFNGNDGEITMITSGGTAPYQYAIDDGFGFQDSNVFTNLSPRNYAVNIRDANGCLFEGNIAVGQPDAIVLNAANTIITDATTTGGADGAIALEISGGTGSYFYEWNGPNVNGRTSKDLTGLVAGTYQVMVTDTNGCTLIEEIVVSEPGPLSINNIQEFNVACNGEESGRITSTVTGNGNITFEWRNVATNTIISTIGEDLENIPAGIYTLTIADDTANPPVTSRQITISEPEILSAEVIPSEVTCFGGNDGVIQVNPVGGTPPYRYSIDGINFQNNNQFNDLFARNYEVTILDNNNCELMANGVVAQPQELRILVDEVKNLTAANTADGAISITVFGGTAPYNYQWVSDTGFTSTDEDISNLEGGTYTLVIRDSNNSSDGDGCYFAQEFIIAEPGELIVTLSQSVFLECNGDDFAELTTNVQGGVAPYTYEWYKVQNGSNSMLSENLGIIGNLTAGIYFVRVTDANSIAVDTEPFTINEPNLLQINLDDKVDVLCAGEATGSISITVTGGTAPYQFYWDNGETKEDLVGLISGSYVLEVVDANGCFTETSITIEEPNNALRIANAIVTDVSEYQANDGSINLEVVGGAGPYNILWTRLSDNTNIGNETSLNGLSADVYEVTVADDNGCTIMENYEISQPDIVEETLVPPTCVGAPDGSISLLVNKGNGVFSYSWNTGDTTNEINGLTAGSYTVIINGLDDGPITRSYELEDPLPLLVDLGEDRVLCDGQQLELDATVTDPTANYLWSSDNGFSSIEPKVILTEKGNYSLIVESENGCTAQGTIFLDVSSEEISAEFAMSSQVFVGEPLILVDISYPLPDSIDWILPEEATVVKSDTDEAELVFTVPGEYEIGIITYRGPCTAQQTKKVLVLAKDGTVNEETEEFNKKIVEDFILFPNPSNGQFNTQINLTERGNVSIRVFSFANNALIASEKARGESSYNISMDISGKPAGVYAVVLETPYGTSLRKLILK